MAGTAVHPGYSGQNAWGRGMDACPAVHPWKKPEGTGSPAAYHPIQYIQEGKTGPAAFSMGMDGMHMMLSPVCRLLEWGSIVYFRYRKRRNGYAAEDCKIGIRIFGGAGAAE